MTTPPDPLETLGRRTAVAMAERSAPDDSALDIVALRRRAQRPRRRQITALAVAVLIAVPVAATQLHMPPDIRLTPAPAPAEWVEVGRDTFNGRGAGAISGIAVTGETIVAVGLEPDPEPGATTRPAAWTSVDGRTWEHHFVSDSGSLYKDAGLLMQDVAAAAVEGAEQLVAVGYANFEPRTQPIVWLSYDGGTTWELRPIEGTGVMTSVIATQSGFVAVGSANGRPAAWTSFNGEGWVRADVHAPERGSPGALFQVAASGDRLVAVGHDGNWEGHRGLWGSDDGKVWEDTGVPHLPDALIHLSSVAAAADGGFLAVGTIEGSGEGSSDAAVWDSSDGVIWERTFTPAPLGTPGDQSLASALVWAGERLVVGSDRGQAAIWASVGDGWEPVFTDAAVPDGGSSGGERIFATPAGVLVTGIATAEQGSQEARIWLRPQTDGPEPAPIEIVREPIGTFGGDQPLGPVVVDGVEVRAGGHSSGIITATDVDTGSELWTYDMFESGFLGPVSGSTLLAASQYGQVVALDIRTGTLRWSLDRHLHVAESPGAPTVVDGVVYVPTTYPVEGDTAPPRLFAVDVASGEVLWRQTLEEGTDLQWAPPVVTDDLVLVADTLSHPRSAPTSWLHAIDRRTGERVWRFDLETRRQGFNDHPPLVRDARVFVAGPLGPLFAIDLATGEEMWRRPADEEPRVLRLEGDALIVELDGRERTIDVEDGAVAR